MLKSHERFHSKNGKRLLLIADDEMINREMLRNILEEEYELIFAENGQEALDQARRYKDALSLILMDIMMPVMSGMDALKAAKADNGLANIPIIVITSDQGAEVESLMLGAIDFIPKPYPQPGVIIARVRRTIELSEDRLIINSTERDELTGLYNREYFYRYAEQYDQYHEETEMDAIVLDINHFHLINERFGTAFGDDVLRRIADALVAAVRGFGGIVCRREADTFMVYCPHGQDYDMILESASISIAAKAGDDDEDTRAWLRMGVYEGVDKNMDIERRFDRAQMAADTVQGSFTKKIGIYDIALHEKELYAEQLIEDFSVAIKERQFKVYYQPKFDIQPEIPVLVSAEALVRWQHPQLGMVSPAAFIPLFEENGLIQRLDIYVWREAAAQIREWKERFNLVVPVSVNVSRIDMYDPHLADILLGVLEDNKLSTNEFLLEITESAYTQDSEQMIETVNNLRDIGFLVEMDDFGTGYSSLNMISSLPVDALKLDMHFIRSAFEENGNTRMLEIIIDIADYLSVPVIAEGVETEEQLVALRNMGCDRVQGYYFSAPVPAEQYEKFVEERNGIQAELPAPLEPSREVIAHHRQSAFGDIVYALTSGFEAIFYVDTESNHYVEFSPRGRRDNLQIEDSGPDFFEEVRELLFAGVHPDDEQNVLQSMRKDALLAQLDCIDPFFMTYRILQDGQPVYHSLKAIKARTNDDHHVVIGISNVDAQILQDTRSEQQRRNEATYEGIVKALAKDYFGIYYVNMSTDRFIEYSSSGVYQSLGIEKFGEDFFNLSRKNIQRVGYPEDLDMFLSAFTKENVLASLESDKTFTLTYRLVLDGKPTYVHMKATSMEGEATNYIVFGISDVTEQMRYEEEHARLLRMANQDALTGVKTKRVYEEEIAKINKAIQEGTQVPFALAICDVNDLKSINDTLGHAAGDKHIKDGCMIICHVFEHSPVYRIGGDEFAVILRGDDYERRDDLVEQLCQSNRAQAALGEEGVLMAGGLAVFDPAVDTNVASVFERADAAMYENKKKLKGV